MVKIIKQGAYYQNGKLEKESQAFMTSDKKEKAIKSMARKMLTKYMSTYFSHSQTEAIFPRTPPTNSANCQLVKAKQAAQSVIPRLNTVIIKGEKLNL